MERIRKIFPFLVSIGLTLTAFFVRLALNPWLGQRSVFLPFTIAMLLSVAWYGFRPALLAMLLSISLVSIFWSVPEVLHGGAVLREVGIVCTFVVTSSGVLVIGDWMHRAKKIAEESSANRFLLAALVESSRDAIFTHSTAGIILSWNQGAEEIYGYKAEQILGRHYTILLPEEARPHALSVLEEVLDYRRAKHFEAERLREDGQRISVSITVSPVLDKAGKIVAISVIARDVTERKRDEQRRETAQKHFQATFEQAAVGMAMVARNGHWLQVNQRLCEMLGYSRGELLAKHFQDVTYTEDYLIGLQALERLAAGAISTCSYEKRYVRKNGEILFVNITVSAVRDPTAYFIAVVEDISARKVAEAALVEASQRAEEAKKRAEDANAAKDRFLAVLSHELRTPLTPVLLTTSALECNKTLPPQVCQELAMIRSNIQTEAQLIDDLLDVTRLGQGKLQIRTAIVDVHSVICEASEVVAGEVAAKHITLTHTLRAADHFANADGARLKQVFWNLLTNAVKFTPPRGTIHVSSCNRDKLLVVRVSDSGIGIAPQILPHIFLPFEQGSDRIVREFGGLGLGLAISKALVEMHDGGITAFSDGAGKGAMFEVVLASVPAPAPTPERPAVNLVRKKAREPAGLKILVVEDHVPTADVLGRLLRRQGHRVTSTSTVAEAKKAAGQDRPDILVSDLNLPDGTGYDIMRHVSTLDGGSPVKGIAVTGMGMQEDIRRSREAGFSCHITKPLNFQQLEAAISEVCASPV